MPVFRRKILFVIILSSLAFVFFCEGSEQDLTDLAEQSDGERAMVWGGESGLGYLRVELRNPRLKDHPSTQDLVIIQPNGMARKYLGIMIQLPPEISPTKGIYQAFVRSPHDMDRFGNRLNGFIAILAPNGELSLYSETPREFFFPAKLQPIR